MRAQHYIMIPPLGIPFEYWIEHVTFRLLYAMFRFSTRVFYMGVPGFATDCREGVWCHGLTTSLVYVGLLHGNLVWNDSGFVSLILWRKTFSLCSIMFDTHLNASQYDDTLFPFTSFTWFLLILFLLLSPTCVTCKKNGSCAVLYERKMTQNVICFPHAYRFKPWRFRLLM